LQRLQNKRRLRDVGTDDFSTIEKKISKHPKTSSRKYSIKLNEEVSKDVSYTTIRSVLNEHGIYAFTPIKKPLLKKRHIQLRKEKTAKILSVNGGCYSVSWSETAGVTDLKHDL
jgi:argininosuccinate synthase